jgi:hypothetical protein
METVFSRLRRLEASKDRSLHEMIVDACDAGDALVEALAGLEPHLDAIICYASTMSEHEPNRLAFNARRALASAYVNDSHTPDNGARAA